MFSLKVLTTGLFFSIKVKVHLRCNSIYEQQQFQSMSEARGYLYARYSIVNNISTSMPSSIYCAYIAIDFQFISMKNENVTVSYLPPGSGIAVSNYLLFLIVDFYNGSR